MSSGARAATATFAVLAGLAAALFLWNLTTIARPVNQALQADSRNESVDLRAHLGHYVQAGVLVLDVREGASASPADMGRVLFQIAEMFYERDRTFTTVVLSHRGTPRFHLPGSRFEELGRDFSAGENPLYLLRTLPEQLVRPDGSAAFGAWEGGLLGVAGRQLEDYNTAMVEWAVGIDSNR